MFPSMGSAVLSRTHSVIAMTIEIIATTLAMLGAPMCACVMRIVDPTPSTAIGMAPWLQRMSIHTSNQNASPEIFAGSFTGITAECLLRLGAGFKGPPA